MRGWCNASSTYEPFKQVRSMITVPRVMAVLCGDTIRDPKEATVSGALGELQSSRFGSMFSLYWSAKSHLRGSWLPTELEVAIYRDEAQGVTKLVVSALLLPRAPFKQEEDDGRDPDGRASRGKEREAEEEKEKSRPPLTPEVQQCRWAIFDGIEDCIAAVPASALPHYNILPRPPPSPVTHALGLGVPMAERAFGWEVVTLKLSAVISEVISTPPPPPAPATPSSSDLGAALAASSSASANETFGGSSGDKHMVLHIRNCSAKTEEKRDPNNKAATSSSGGPQSPGRNVSQAAPPSPKSPMVSPAAAAGPPPDPAARPFFSQGTAKKCGQSVCGSF